MCASRVAVFLDYGLDEWAIKTPAACRGVVCNGGLSGPCSARPVHCSASCLLLDAPPETPWPRCRCCGPRRLGPGKALLDSNGVRMVGGGSLQGRRAGVELKDVRDGWGWRSRSGVVGPWGVGWCRSCMCPAQTRGWDWVAGVLFARRAAASRRCGLADGLRAKGG